MYRLLFVVFVALCGAGSVLAQGILIGADRGSPNLRVINTTTGAAGATIAISLITVPPTPMVGVYGLAMDPTTGILYASTRDSLAGHVFRLITVNYTTGAATLIGTFSETGIADIKFNSAGQLYAVTGEVGGNQMNPETLWTVNKTTAACTLAFAMGNGDNGETIGFNPTNPGVMYHWSGSASAVFETVNLSTSATSNIGFSGTPFALNILALGWDSNTSTFYTSSSAGQLGRITTAGAYTLIGNTGPVLKGLVVVPTITHTVSSPPLNLGSTTVGTSSAQVSFNTAGFNMNTPINVAAPANVQVSLSATTGYAGNINTAAPAASRQLASTQIFVRIAASAPVGPVSGNLTLTSSGATTVTIAVTGTVNPPPAPEIDVFSGTTAVADASVHNVGGMIVGAQTLNYRIENNGTAPLNLTGMAPFVVTGTPVNVTGLTINPAPTTPIAASANSTFTANFTISAVGPFSFTLSIANDDASENPYNWTVSGTGTAAPEPEMDVFRNAVAVADGGTDALGTIQAQVATTLTYDIQNNGTAPLAITTPVAPANETNCVVTVTTQPTNSVAASGATTLVLTVTPAGNLAFSFTISIVNTDADENPYNWTVSGTGLIIEPEMDVERGATPVPDGSTDDVGTHTSGMAFMLTYTITNNGNGDLAVSNPVINTANCTVPPATLPVNTLAPLASTTLQLTVTPLSAGSFSVDVSMANDDPDENPYNWLIEGIAVDPPPEMEVARAATAITDGGTDAAGGRTTGAAFTLTYTISNVGTGPLNLTVPVTIASETNCTATVTTEPGATVAAPGSTSMTISVTPLADGAFSFDVSIDNNDADENPYNWTVQGMASTPPPPEEKKEDNGCAAGAGALPLFAVVVAALYFRRRRQTASAATDART